MTSAIRHRGLVRTLPCSSGRAALIALAGAALLAALRRLLAGAICGTVAFAVVILQAVYFGGANIVRLLVCRDMSRPCSDEWQNIGWAALGLALAVYLLVAIWKARRSTRHA